MAGVRQRQVIAEHDLEAARGAREPEGDGLEHVGPVVRDIELEVARDIRHPDDIRDEQLAVGKGGDVKPDPDAKGDVNRVGIGEGQVVGLTGDKRRGAIGGQNGGAGGHARTEKGVP